MRRIIVMLAVGLLGAVGDCNTSAQSLTAAGTQLAVPAAGPGTSVGLQGYYFFDCNAGSDLSSLPGYATVTDLANGYTGGDYSYLTVSGTTYQTGVQYTTGGNLASVTFGTGAPATVRLGILLDSSSQASGVTVVTASRSGATLTVDHSGSSPVHNDFYFVDVSGIQAGDTITVSATGVPGVDANIGGITFDVPPTVTLAAAAAQLGVTAVGPGTGIGLLGSYFFDCDNTADINNAPAYTTVNGLANPSPGNINLTINGVSHLTGTESVGGGAAGDVASVTFGAGTPSSVLLGILLDNQTNPPGPIVLRASNGGPQLTIDHSGSAPVNNDFYFVNVGGIVVGETIFINAGSATNDNLGGITFDAGIGSLAPTVLTQPRGVTNVVGSTITLTASISGIPAPTLQWQFNGASLPGATNATLNLSNLQLTNGGSYVLYATNAIGWTNTSPAAVTVQALTPELVGEWTFAGQTLANSGATGPVNDGTYSIAGVSNAPVFSADVPFGNGNSLDLTALDSYLRINNSASGDAGYSGLFDAYAPSFSVAVWEKKPNPTWQDDAWNGLAAKNNGYTASNKGFMLGRDGLGNTPVAQMYDGAYPAAYGTTDINDGTWHHLAMTYDAPSTTISLYVDGVLQGTASGVYSADTMDALVFGASVYPVGWRAANALVYDPRFYNYALSASQIAGLYGSAGILSPADGQDVPMDLTPTLSLSWLQNNNAIAYDVYLGTISNSVIDASIATSNVYIGTTNALTFPAGSLTPNTTYYWRVDSVAANGTVTRGAVLSFTTGSHMTDLMEDTWVATDALGRSLPGNAQCGDARTNRPIGIFYFVDQDQYTAQYGLGTNWDDTKYISEHPFTDPNNPWADNPVFNQVNNGTPFYWGEPALGYYNPTDPWVLRREIAQLNHAGVDVLIFDASNGPTYDREVAALCNMIEQMRFEGTAINLKVAFLTHNQSGAVATYLYNNFYCQNKYADLWCSWQGKPLILGYQNGTGAGDIVPSAAVQTFFTWRVAWAGIGGHDVMAWIDSGTPQQFGYDSAPDHPESAPVTCGGWSTANIGRSYTNNNEPAYDNYQLPVAGTQRQGLFFSQQMAYGLKYDPRFLFITGWNEWIAGSWLANLAGSVSMLDNPCPLNGYYFVDEYNEEYSRDIEPMKGGHTDNYYYQMVGQNRLRKGARPLPAASVAQTINLAGGFLQWTNISPAYYDAVNDTVWRNFPSAVALIGNYTNNSGRNDLIVMKVAGDARNIYFMAQCNSSISSYTGSNWMVLFIDTDQNHLTDWEGYDFVVNLGARNAATTTLSQNVSTSDRWSWSTVRSDIAYTVSGNQLMLAIPRVSLGLTNDPIAFDFHWADNFQTNDISDFGVDGDSAPDGRFNYRYEARKTQEVVFLQDNFEQGKQAFWDETWTNGSCWGLTTNAPYSGSLCAVASTSIGTDSAMFIGRANTGQATDFRLTFHYKLNNVNSAQSLNLYYRATNGWVFIRQLSRDQYYPAGQSWSYDEQQNVWLNFTDARHNCGTNAQFFNANFAFYIDASSLANSSQSVWIDDVTLAGWTSSMLPPVLQASFNGGILVVSWPQGYAGWQLQSQTNPLNLRLNSNWANVSGVISNSLTIAPDKTKSTVFFRLAPPSP